MNWQAPHIASLLEELGFLEQKPSLMAIGIADPELSGVVVTQAYESLSGPNELPHSLRVDLGIVVTPLNFMSRRNAEQLLARLRDVHCDKILLLDTDRGWKPEALRALGFLEVKRPSTNGRCYLFDPEMFNQPREWNNPSNWANPEHFRKYRW